MCFWLRVCCGLDCFHSLFVSDILSAIEIELQCSFPMSYECVYQKQIANENSLIHYYYSEIVCGCVFVIKLSTVTPRLWLCFLIKLSTVTPTVFIIVFL